VQPVRALDMEPILRELLNPDMLSGPDPA
jgi:hypothetical protein